MIFLLAFTTHGQKRYSGKIICAIQWLSGNCGKSCQCQSFGGCPVLTQVIDIVYIMDHKKLVSPFLLVVSRVQNQLKLSSSDKMQPKMITKHKKIWMESWFVIMLSFDTLICYDPIISISALKPKSNESLKFL